MVQWEGPIARGLEDPLVLLNGPVGVGKTTVSRALAALEQGTVRVAGDDLRAFAPQNARAVLGPGSTYRVGALLADAYFGMGASRVIFEYVFESARQVQYFREGMASDRQIHLVTLWAPSDVVLMRNANRGERRNFREDRVQTCHAAMATNLAELGWILETSSTSGDDVARAIHERLRSGGFPWRPST